MRATETETPITDLLQAWSDEGPQAWERLAPVVYQELQRIARDQFAAESEGHTLQPTALVNEVFLHFVERRQVQWRNRDQFFGFAAQVMRRILVDHARMKKAPKRGGDARNLSLAELSPGELPVQLGLVDEEILRLHDALKDMECFSPECRRIVEMRFFGGLKYEEIAKILGVSASTVRNRWKTAKLWLYQELKKKMTE